MLFVVFVSFYLVQRKNDRRKKIEKIEQIVSKIQEIINDPSIYSVSAEESKQKALMLHRTCSNKINLLRDTEMSDEENKCILNISDEFRRIREFIGEHLEDQGYIDKSKTTITNYIVKIDDLCDTLQLLLYK